MAQNEVKSPVVTEKHFLVADELLGICGSRIRESCVQHILLPAPAALEGGFKCQLFFLSTRAWR